MSTIQEKGIFSEKMLLISIGFAVVYWILDAIFWVFASVKLGFFHNVFRPDLGEMGARIIVVCLFLIFGSHAQYTIKARRKADQEVSRLLEKIVELQKELAELKEK
jgi:signal transduction histidine kinase